MNVLLVEDEISISNAVKKMLEIKGYSVTAVYDGLSAVKSAEAGQFDAIILDVMLPVMDGFEVLRTIRKDRVGTPVLMLTARTTLNDKVTGLDHGADDYMTKPFDMDEMIARVGALTRRRGNLFVNDVTFADVTLDLTAKELACNGEKIGLSAKEFEILKLLMQNPSGITSPDKLISAVWGTDSEATYNNVEVYVTFIRKKLKFLNSRVTVKKIQKTGYFLEATEE